MRTLGFVAAGLFVSSVVVANWLTSTFHFVPVGFGQSATAGTFAAGFALASRDVVQDILGKKWMLTALLAAGLVSFVVADPHIAAASAVAFMVAELLDFAVYTPLRERGRFGGRWWGAAVGVSGVVGAVVDTVVFIGIAFGFAMVWAAMLGQLLGKVYATVLYLIAGRAGAVLRESHRQPEGA